MDRLRVELGENSYEIVFSEDFCTLSSELAKTNSPKKLLVVTDSNVEKLYGNEVSSYLCQSGYDVKIHSFKAGEENKNMQTILGICEACMHHGMDRKSQIIALGGGVVGDMAGFAAAIYMRGISFVQIPTTLLSQSDSSVGGKTGIDFCDAKNILGAFLQPRLVYINVSTLKTLPAEQFVSGMGEVIKHGIIRDRKFFEYICENIKSIKALDTNTLIALSKKNCTIKADIVSKDEKENGLRAILNFGHTIGHAIESAYEFRMTHGECVALGMIAVCKIAIERGMLLQEDMQKIEDALISYGFRTRVKIPPVDVVLSYMDKDKKKQHGALGFVLPLSIGAVVQKSDVTREEILSALKYISE